MKRNIKTAGAVVLAGALFAAGGMGAATAKDWIDGGDLKPGSVTAGKLSDGVLNGIKGEKGKRGPRGPQGPAGESGTAGAEGVRGAQGETGPAGPAGTPGAPGAPGTNGTNGTNGTDGVDGADGVSGYYTKYSEVAVLTGATTTITLSCNAGEVALGGGFYSDQDGSFRFITNGPVFAQTPKAAGQTGQTGMANGWTVKAVNTDSAKKNLTAVVNCATAL